MKLLRFRLLFAGLLVAAMALHQQATSDLPNTPLGMLVFHGSAAAIDLVLLCGAHLVISGRLCDDMEALFASSIVGNATGWWLYLAYAPPVIYDVLMWGITYVQLARLLLVDRNDADADHSRVAMVRLADRVRGHLHFGKATV